MRHPIVFPPSLFPMRNRERGTMGLHEERGTFLSEFESSDLLEEREAGWMGVGVKRCDGIGTLHAIIDVFVCDALGFLPAFVVHEDGANSCVILAFMFNCCTNVGADCATEIFIFVHVLTPFLVVYAG